MLALHPAAHRLLGQHLVDGEVLADVAQEVDEPSVGHGPRPVVDAARPGRARLEVEEARAAGA